MSNDPDSLLTLAGICDELAAARSRLVKQRRLAVYLHGLDATALPLAIRYLDAGAFARTEERVLGVSGSLLLDAVLPILGIDYETLRPLAVRLGELGEAIAAVWRQGEGDDPPALRLIDLQRHFDQLAATTAPDAKRRVLGVLWSGVRAPREAATLAKIILGEMRTGVREGVLVGGVARAFGREEAEVRRGLMLIGDLGEVAVLAREDRLACASFKLFHPVQFMLATPIATADDAFAYGQRPGSYRVEPKLDGIRAQVHKQGDRVAIYSRTMDRIDANFPEVVEQLREVRRDLLLDGELLAWCDDRPLPFAMLQKRLGRTSDLAAAVRRVPCRFVAFDLLYLDGRLLLDRPFAERRAALNGCGHEPLTDSQIVGDAGGVRSAFAAALAGGYEGLMLKDPARPYSPGKRGSSWLKLKTHLPTLDCVVTFAQRGHGRRRDVLSDYTFALWDQDPASENARLLNIGKAYSGLTDAEIHALTARLHHLAVESDGRLYRVRPQIVLEIAFEAVTKSSRHDSGYALRFPRILRIRDDKPAEQADRLARLVDIYNSFDNPARDAPVPRSALVQGEQLPLFGPG